MNLFYDPIIASSIKGEIPWSETSLGYKKRKILKSVIEKIEIDTGIPYPDVYISNTLKILIHESQIQSIIFAHLDFKKFNQLKPIISLSLPTLIYNDKTVLTSILSHELLHYMYIISKSKTGTISSLNQIFGSTLSGSNLIDEILQINPHTLFKTKKFVMLVTNLHKTLDNPLLHDFFQSQWIEKNLPTKYFTSEKLTLTLSPLNLLNLDFPKSILSHSIFSK